MRPTTNPGPHTCVIGPLAWQSNQNVVPTWNKVNPPCMLQKSTTPFVELTPSVISGGPLTAQFTTIVPSDPSEYVIARTTSPPSILVPETTGVGSKCTRPVTW